MTIVGVRERHHGQNKRRDHEHGAESGQNSSDEEDRSGQQALAWVLTIPLLLLLLLLAALPVTFSAVAIRPSHATVRAAAVTLLALPVVVILLIVVGRMA
jgi:hypothetical protein